MSKSVSMDKLLYFFIRDKYVEVGSKRVYFYRFYPPNLSILTKHEKEIEIKILSDFLDAINMPVQFFGMDKVEDLNKNIDFFNSMNEKYKIYTQQIVDRLTAYETNSSGGNSIQRAYYFVIKVKSDEEVATFEDALNSQGLKYSKVEKTELVTVFRNFFLREFSSLNLYSFESEMIEKYESNANRRTKKA